MSRLRVQHGFTDEEGGILMQRLQDAGLVEARDDRICSTFPIVTGEGQARYAELTVSVAEAAQRYIERDLLVLLNLIRERNWHDWAYHFVWSQVFDSQYAWTEMISRGLVPPLAPVIAWVVYPDHGFRSGTNYYPDADLRDYWLMVSWRAGGANTTDPVGRNWELLYHTGIEVQPIEDKHRDELTKLGLLSEAGTVGFPVIRRGDTVQALLEATARRYVGYLMEHMPTEEIADIAGVNRQRAFAMAYHDVSWEILARLNDSGIISTPEALQRYDDRSGRLSLRGVFAAAPVHTPFVDLILEALASQ